MSSLMQNPQVATLILVSMVIGTIASFIMTRSKSSIPGWMAVFFMMIVVVGHFTIGEFFWGCLWTFILVSDILYVVYVIPHKQAQDAPKV